MDMPSPDARADAQPMQSPQTFKDRVPLPKVGKEREVSQPRPFAQPSRARSVVPPAAYGTTILIGRVG